MNIKNIVDSQNCIKCDICCYFDANDQHCTPCFTEKDFAALPQQLREYVAKDATGFYRPVLIDGHTPDDDKICPFLTEKSHECSIYAFRPLDCELWPFRLAYRKEGSLPRGGFVEQLSCSGRWHEAHFCTYRRACSGTAKPWGLQ